LHHIISSLKCKRTSLQKLILPNSLNFYFIRFIAGLATTVTSNNLIKEKASNTKKAIKKNNSRIKLRRIINVKNVRLTEEDTG
jgi:hypothetical protein